MERLNHGGGKTGSSTKGRALVEREEWLSRQLVDIAYNIHKTLGPGLLESVYEKCFCHELTVRNIPFTRQQHVDIIYNELLVRDGLRIDIFVDNLIIVELKAQEIAHPVWEAQLLSYMRLTKTRLGFIFNFHVPLIKNGIRRMVL